MADIKSGAIQLPSIQRDWTWNDEKVRDIIASVISDYPIGAVLFLECKKIPDFECTPINGVELSEDVSPENLILDGQQRLTAIYCAMYNVGKPVYVTKGKKAEEHFYYLDIEKVLEDTNDKFDAIISVPKNKKIKKNNKDKNSGLDLSTIEKEFENKMFPLNIILNHEEETAENLMTKSKWENQCKDYYREKDEKLYRQICAQFESLEKIFDKLNRYTIPVISLSKNTKLDAVCKIFEKVNSSNEPLTAFDLLNAIYAKKKCNLNNEWEEIKRKTFSKGILTGIAPKDFLRACKLFAGYKNNSYDNFKKNIIIDLKYEDYESSKEIVAEGFKKAKALLEEEGIISQNRLPYSSQLIPLSVICALLAENIANSDNVRQKVKQWYWCGVFSKYYENAANDSKFFKNISSVMDWIVDGDKKTPDMVKDFSFDLEKLKDITANSGALFYGIIALIVKNNCKDFASGRFIKDLFRSGNEDETVEIHHIFPKESYENKYRNFIDSVINKTPISRKTNKVLGDVAPSVYLEKITTGDYSDGKKKKRVKNTSADFVSRENLKSHLLSHFINISDLESDNFEDFICHRAMYLLNEIALVTDTKISNYDVEEVKKNFFGQP